MKIREKMIALIYLVLIALMVINIEGESFINFDKFAESLNLSIFLVDEKNQQTYKELKENSIKNPFNSKNKLAYEKSKKFKTIIDSFFSFIENLKKEYKENKNLQKKIFFSSKTFNYKLKNKDSVLKKIVLFKKKIIDFKNFAIDFYEDFNDKKRIKKLFHENFLEKEAEISFIKKFIDLIKLQLDLKNEETFLLQNLLKNSINISNKLVGDNLKEHNFIAGLYASKMNVLYKGVDNPLSGFILGISPKNLTLETISNGKLQLKAPGKWTYQPGISKEAFFILKGINYSGKKISQKIHFRIKDLPEPKCLLRGELEPKIPFSSLKNATLSVIIPGFEFPIKIIIKSFYIKIPSKASIFCKGNRFSSSALNALKSLPLGKKFIIYNIEASLEGEKKIQLKKIPPLKVLITN